MGKGTTTTTPQIPKELSGLYSQTARNINYGQNVLPLFGGAGVVPGRRYDPSDDTGGQMDDGQPDPRRPLNRRIL